MCAEVLSLSDRLLQEGDAVGPISSSSSSPVGSSIPQLQQAEGLHLMASSSAPLDSITAAAAASIPPAAKQLQWAGMVQLAAFCVFEVLIGMFWPSMMTLRAKYVPEQQRSTIINIFRIPLNLFVCLILWKVRKALTCLHDLQHISMGCVLLRTCTGGSCGGSQCRTKI